ncbi:MAG: DoxX family protein [Xanthobacteraceae bacterium]
MDSLKTYLAALARLLMSSLFIWAGVGNLRNMSGTVDYLAHVNVPIPGVTAWIVMLIHLLGGLAILVGFKTRWAAIVLALFCLVTAFAIHLPVGDLTNMIMFYKNLVMAGGFIYVVAYGPGGISMDRRMA